MRKHKFLTSAILTGAICLLTVLAFTTEKAEAWGWYGFTDLRLYSEFRGPEGETLTIWFEDVVVRTSCYNFQSGIQHGVETGLGNLGFEELITDTEPAEGSKIKGVVKVEGGLQLDDYDLHPMKCPDGEKNCDESEKVPAWPGDPEYDSSSHIHTCWPAGNQHKIEVPDSAWIESFTVHWELTGKKPNSGTDTCTWDEGRWSEIGVPESCIPFTCIEDSIKKINWIKDSIPPECEGILN